MAPYIRDSLSEFGKELLGRIRETSNARLEEAAFEERVIGIEKATAALVEATVEDEKIIYLLQKYWIYASARLRNFCSKKDTLKRSN
ncbi:hypothetical protein ACFOZ1_14690 [Gracilibacillus marinus]|uniref:Uncharacterized protein n=1 Tax=Gracilibacillus marinus TaxID=630535 RepID=A0ABV8VX06_9BACI